MNGGNDSFNRVSGKVYTDSQCMLQLHRPIEQYHLDQDSEDWFLFWPELHLWQGLTFQTGVKFGHSRNILFKQIFMFGSMACHSSLITTQQWSHAQNLVSRCYVCYCIIGHREKVNISSSISLLKVYCASSHSMYGKFHHMFSLVFPPVYVQDITQQMSSLSWINVA